MLELLGDKRRRANSRKSAGVPVVPGTERPVTSTDAARKMAGEIGFPLIVKAAFGGGGRGMRVVEKAGDFAERLEEARREAGAAFGNDAVFLERYIRRARHVEVQILGDQSRQHPASLRARLLGAAPASEGGRGGAGAGPGGRNPARRWPMPPSGSPRAAGYYNAGTVEFLVDADTGEWYFIEVNPRIQVEHTVTEMVTGIDLVRSQILIAQGHALHDPPLSLPAQDKVPLYGHALQCRITTEDPANNFVPDYGKIHTYRSPAGFGIRLDGGSAYSGAIITPFYDSLLVKVTAWASEFDQACKRMDRALREFRMRGVKTNIPFLENVVNNPQFQAGDVTTVVPRRASRAVPLHAAPRPRHQAAHLSGRRDRQRQSGSRRQAAAGALPCPGGSRA